MDIMKNYYQDASQTSEEDFAAQLTIAISQDGEFIFGCDWEPNEIGITAVASIFYAVAYDQLTDQVLKDLKAQCVLEGKEDDFVAIAEAIKNLILLHQSSDSGGDLAVPPRNVLKL